MQDGSLASASRAIVCSCLIANPRRSNLLISLAHLRFHTSYRVLLSTSSYACARRSCVSAIAATTTTPTRRAPVSALYTHTSSRAGPSAAGASMALGSRAAVSPGKTTKSTFSATLCLLIGGNSRHPLGTSFAPASSLGRRHGPLDADPPPRSSNNCLIAAPPNTHESVGCASKGRCGSGWMPALAAPVPISSASGVGLR